MAQYQYKAGEVGIVGKLNAIADYNAAFPVAMNYLQQGALSPDGFQLWNGERTSKLGGGGGGKISFKVGRKGGVCAYGLQRNPVTLYAEQWERLLAPEVVKELLAYIASDPETFHPAKDGEPAMTAKIQRKSKQAA
jgi:hypothetical protein